MTTYARPLGNRRLRQNSHIRELTQEVYLHPQSFIQPLFVADRLSDKEAIPGIPGTYRDTPDTLMQQIESDIQAGIRKFLLFGVPLSLIHI